MVQYKNTRGSGVPMDQALEKSYNKTSKSSGGVIDITKRKEAMAKWDLIHHEKLNIRTFMEDVTHLTNDSASEYSLHHEFSNSTVIKHDIASQKYYIIWNL